jgi:putative ABC transport system permease protein
VSDFWLLAVRAIRARPLRSILTASAVALGVAVVLAVQIAIQGLTAQAAEAQMEQAGASSLDVRVDVGSGLTPAQVTVLSELPGVVQAVPLYEKQVTAGPAGSALEGQTVTLVGLQDSSAALRSVSVAAGRLPLPGSTSEVALDQGLSTALTGGFGSPIRIGQKIQLITSTGPDLFTVVGFTSGTSGGPTFTHDAVFVDDAAMLGPFALGLHTPLVALRFGPGATVAAVSSEVRARFGASVTTYDPRSSAGAPLQELEPLLVLATVLSLIVGAGVAANSAALAAYERRREIGLLRAAGASSRQVFRLFAVEVATIAAAGVPVGVVAGLILGGVFNSSLTPADLAAPSLMPQVGQVVAAIAAGLGAALVGGLLPLFAAARLPILEALRPHPIGEHQRASVLLRTASPVLLLIAAICFLSSASGLVALGVVAFLLGVVVALPLIAPLVIRLLALAISPLVTGAESGAAHLARARNRTAMTTAGLAIAVATAVGVSALSAGALTASDQPCHAGRPGRSGDRHQRRRRPGHAAPIFLGERCGGLGGHRGNRSCRVQLARRLRRRLRRPEHGLDGTRGWAELSCARRARGRHGMDRRHATPGRHAKGPRVLHDRRCDQPLLPRRRRRREPRHGGRPRPHVLRRDSGRVR